TASMYQRSAVDSPALVQAQAIDMDHDGLTDVIGLSQERKPVLLHNDGQRLMHTRERLGLDKDWPRDLVAVMALDVNGDGFPDLLTWSESAGLEARLSRGNPNHSVR